MALTQGDRFESYADLQARVRALERSTNTVFFKERARGIASFVKSSPTHRLSKCLDARSDKADIISNVKYRCITYWCDKGGRAPPERVDRKRSTRSKKAKCNAHFTVSLDDEMKLVVRSMHLDHNHETSEAAFRMMPKNRRLPETLKSVVRQHAALGANKSRIRDMIRGDYDINVTRDDLNNILRKADAVRDDVGAQVELLTEQGFSCTVVKDEVAGAVCGIFFQDEEMKSTYKKFPELLLLDATYKLVDTRSAVFTIMGVDSLGLGVPLGVFLATEETSSMIGSMLEAFRVQNPDTVAKTKVWLTDKDAAEKNAIREHFPDCQQFVCTFHVLQAFRREVQPMLRGNSENRDRVLKQMQRLPFADTEDEYWRYRAEITHDGADQYLKANWDDIRDEWVRGLSGQMAGTFTNNHLESLHGKLKGVCKLRETFDKFVKGYKAVLSSIRAERNNKIFCETSKQPTQPFPGELGDLQKLLTSRAFQLLVEQSQLADSAVGCEQTTSDGMVCECMFYRQFSLPCQHIIAYRRANHISPLFPSELIPERWCLTYLVDHLETQVIPPSSSPTISVRAVPRAKRPQTEHQRFARLNTVAKQIASVGAELTGSAFDALHANLSQVLDCVRRGQSFWVAEEVEGVDACNLLDHLSADSPNGSNQVVEAAAGEGVQRTDDAAACGARNPPSAGLPGSSGLVVEESRGDNGLQRDNGMELCGNGDAQDDTAFRSQVKVGKRREKPTFNVMSYITSESEHDGAHESGVSDHEYACSPIVSHRAVLSSRIASHAVSSAGAGASVSVPGPSNLLSALSEMRMPPRAKRPPGRPKGSNRTVAGAKKRARRSPL